MREEDGYAGRIRSRVFRQRFFSFVFYFYLLFSNYQSFAKIVVQRELTLSVDPCVALRYAGGGGAFCHHRLICCCLSFKYGFSCGPVPSARIFVPHRGEKNSHGDFRSRGKTRVVIVVASVGVVHHAGT